MKCTLSQNLNITTNNAGIIALDDETIVARYRTIHYDPELLIVLTMYRKKGTIGEGRTKWSVLITDSQPDLKFSVTDYEVDQFYDQCLERLDEKKFGIK